MKTVKLLLKNMRISSLRKIIAMVFVGISVCTMNIAFSGYLYQENLNNTVKNSGLYDNYMFATTHNPSISLSEKSEERKLVKERLSELQLEGIVESFCEIATVNGPYSNDFENDRAEIVFYPKEFACDVNFPAVADTWMTEQNFGNDDDSLVPMVVGNDFKDKFERIHVNLTEIYGFNAYLCGVLEKDALVLVSKTSGNGLDLNLCFETANDKIIFGHACDSAAPKAFVIKTSSENSENAQRRVLNEIGDAYYTFSFKDLGDKTYEENRLMTEKKSIVFIISLIVCLVGVGSSNLINTINQKKRYAVFFFCGMELKKGIVLTVIENIIQMIIPAVIGYFAFLKYCEWQMYLFLRIEAANLWMTILLLLGMFAFTTLKPLMDIRKSSPVKIIGET